MTTEPKNSIAGGDGGQNAAVGGATDILRFERWLGELGKLKASDLHLTAGNTPMLRLGGKIVPLEGEEILTAEGLERIAEHLLSKEELSKLKEEKQIALGMTLKKSMRFRAHVFYNRGFIAFSLRHLEEREANWQSLGLPAVAAEFSKAKEGLLIITGPFDSGKTTTARSLIAEINHTQPRYIAILEHPIEYIIPSDKSVVVQREVGRDVPSFAQGLVALQDEDVDVVVVSAVEDWETAQNILKLAASGKLVIAVGSSQDLIGFLEEFRDKFPPQNQPRVLNELADCLLGGLAQLLLPAVGGGRVMLAEVLRANHSVKTLIRENKLRQITNIMQMSRQEGMITLDKALEEAVKAGKIAPEDAKAHSLSRAPSISVL